MQLNIGARQPCRTPSTRLKASRQPQCSCKIISSRGPRSARRAAASLTNRQQSHAVAAERPVHLPGAVTEALADKSTHAPLAKVCGVHSPEDAALAASAGASFVGMILWPLAKRAVDVATASSIAAAARRGGAQPVAVFVDEDAETIAQVCSEAGIGIAQLHGDGARASLQRLPSSLQVIYVLHATPDGAIQTALPGVSSQPLTASGRWAALVARRPDWLLVDGLKGGSGEALDWHALEPPLSHAKNGWILAGGLTPENVAEAASIAQPSVVDVSSGVAGPDGVTKDAVRVRAFVRAATSGLRDAAVALRQSGRTWEL